MLVCTQLIRKRGRRVFGKVRGGLMSGRHDWRDCKPESQIDNVKTVRMLEIDFLDLSRHKRKTGNGCLMVYI